MSTRASSSIKYIITDTIPSVVFFAPEISRLPPKAYYWIFISADIICLILQAAGGALSTASQGSSQVGIDIAMGGLILQVIVLVAFAALTADYLVRYARLQRRRGAASVMGRRQKIFFAGLGTAFALIIARCAFRVDELSEGYTDSDKVTNELLFILLEGVLIYLAVLALTVGHPGLGFRREEGEVAMGTSAEKTASGGASSEEVLSAKNANGAAV